MSGCNNAHRNFLSHDSLALPLESQPARKKNCHLITKRDELQALLHSRFEGEFTNIDCGAADEKAKPCEI